MTLTIAGISNLLRHVSHEQMALAAFIIGIAFLFVLGGIIYVVSHRIAARMDYDRRHRHIAAQRGRVRSCRRAFFGKGWLGSNERIYEIRYVDAQGNQRDVTCKTSLLSGVYVTEDHPVRAGVIPSSPPPPSPPGESRLQFLEEENRRLREALARLKARLDSNG
jgi:hypothetical protein